MKQVIKRGEIFWAKLSPVVGSEQGGLRPVLILQNDIGNKFSPTVLATVLTKQQKKRLPTHVFLDKRKYKLTEDSWVLLEQIRTLDKWRIQAKISRLDDKKLDEVDTALKISLGIKEDLYKYYRHIVTGEIVRIKAKDIR
ncbi:type II toxin-antitoxin system PemK/MazF family toxin [Bacillus sp. sid0103]|uniref:type II toxin-antitoxin system PemK/MazF family toxin n=1 Tax=Bacillus sp. sid0103 TaxID=2856337 RepID=UPI001C484658|nr:type II toxin-antitoxin system PemK/MazF family toxin [Bacillus sp. sid0103]MBV7509689.1 type II toxin-antitoxin system PemK/MazF family toxin [Bacillus sp. sid0103]